MNNCIFCENQNLDIFVEGDHTLAFKDKFPVTKGHTLIIPRKHRLDFFEMTEKERIDAFVLIDEIKERMTQEDPSITGFNIGMNCGESAGQTIFHCHIHLIPRRDGDLADPTGGVRGVIPEKMRYSLK